MSAFFYGVILQFKLDFRNRSILLTYYIIPLLFFMFMGMVFTSIMPDSEKTLVQAMTVFGVSMGAFLGAPASLGEVYGSEIRKAYRVGKVPLWTVAANSFISGFIHLFIMSFLIFLIAPPMFDAAIPKDLPYYFLSLAAFIAVCMMVGVALGTIVGGSSKLVMIEQIIFLPSILLSGIMFPASMLPDAIQYAGKVFPASWGFINLCNDKIVWDDTWPLILIFVVVFIITAWGISRLKTKE